MFYLTDGVRRNIVYDGGDLNLNRSFEMEYLRCVAIISEIITLTFLIGVLIYQLYLLIKGK